MCNGTECRFMILSLPRTGSTSLARLLNSHKDIQCLVEPFHPKRYQGKFYSLALRRSIEVALSAIWTRWNGIKHVYESNGWPFCALPELNDRLALVPSQKIIYLIRRNLLRRVVSNLICRRTQFWIGTREEFLVRLRALALPPLSPEAVRRQIEADKRAIDERVEWFAQNRVPALVMYYEDLFREDAVPAEQLALINSILEFLGLSRITMGTFLEHWQRQFAPSVYKWASAEVYQAIPDIERIERSVGSYETGWLFQ